MFICTKTLTPYNPKHAPLHCQYTIQAHGRQACIKQPHQIILKQTIGFLKIIITLFISGTFKDICLCK